VEDQLLTHNQGSVETVTVAPPTQEPGNDTAEIPDSPSPTLRPGTSGDKSQWPFTILTGRGQGPGQTVNIITSVL